MAARLERVAFHSSPIDTVAVAARLTRTGTHVGVAYRGPEGTEQFLHFCFHLDLENEDFAPSRSRYVCVVPNLHRAELVALAGFCRRVYRANARGVIPYNLAYEAGTMLDPDTGDLVIAENGTGMTCATFVVHLFRSLGIPIIDMTDWPAGRPGDRERQEELVRMLATHPSPEYMAHAARIRGQIGCPRVRPEEVAGACLEDVLPAAFEQCESNGRTILTMLHEGVPDVILHCALM